MRYTLYRLTADGMTPTENITCGMRGCEYVKDGDNLAYLTGTKIQIDYTLEACDYTELTVEEAKAFAFSCYPESMMDEHGKTWYPQTPIVMVDGTIRIPMDDSPLGTPNQTERLESVETAVLDLLLGA